MICNNCGHENIEGAVFCANCGHNLVNSNIKKSNDRQNNSSNNKLIFISITIIICVIILCGTVLLTQNSNTDNSYVANSTNVSNEHKDTTTESQITEEQSSSGYDDEDGYIEGNKITYRNENYLGSESGLEEFSTDYDSYLKQKSTGRIAKRHLDDDGVYRYYDMQTGECVMG